MQNKSDTSQILSKDNCDLQAFPLQGMKHIRHNPQRNVAFFSITFVFLVQINKVRFKDVFMVIYCPNGCYVFLLDYRYL